MGGQVGGHARCPGQQQWTPPAAPALAPPACMAGAEVCPAPVSQAKRAIGPKPGFKSVIEAQSGLELGSVNS